MDWQAEAALSNPSGGCPPACGVGAKERKMMTPKEAEFFKEHRWDLAKSHLERSDQAATLLRGLLFTAAIAAIGLILQQRAGTGLRWHSLSLVPLIAAACLIFWSWDTQKSKAIGRFKALAKNDFGTYYGYKEIENQKMDRWAGILTVCGAVVEILLCILPN
jgi:hypothetical protein